MLKRLKPDLSPAPPIVSSLEEFLEAIENCRDELLILRINEVLISINGLEAIDLSLIEAALQGNPAIKALALNDQIYNVPLSDDFVTEFLPLPKLLKKIKDHADHSALSLSVGSRRIYLQDDTILQILAAISQNMRIRSIDVGGLQMPIMAVNSVIHTFLHTYNLQRLRFPLWDAIVHNSQREVEECFDELPKRVQDFNEENDNARNKYLCFALGVARMHNRQRTTSSERGCYAAKLPSDVVQRIGSFTAAKPKALDLAYS